MSGFDSTSFMMGMMAGESNSRAYDNLDRAIAEYRQAKAANARFRVEDPFGYNLSVAEKRARRRRVAFRMVAVLVVLYGVGALLGV